jgi:hypothetical protein
LGNGGERLGIRHKKRLSSRAVLESKVRGGPGALGGGFCFAYLSRSAKAGQDIFRLPERFLLAKRDWFAFAPEDLQSHCVFARPWQRLLGSNNELVCHSRRVRTANGKYLAVSGVVGNGKTKVFWPTGDTPFVTNQKAILLPAPARGAKPSSRFTD